MLELKKDDIVPLEIRSAWNKYISKLHYLNNTEVERKDIVNDDAKTFIGAKTDIRQLQNVLRKHSTQADFESFLAIRHICWHFIHVYTMVRFQKRNHECILYI